MELSKTTFLGTNQITRAISGCVITLTSYSGNLEFEEWHAHENPSVSSQVQCFIA